MRAGGHVGGEQVDAPVVVEVANIAAHREPRRVRHGVADDVFKRAVAAVAVEHVRSAVVVRDVEVGVAVGVVVEPGR